MPIIDRFGYHRDDHPQSLCDLCSASLADTEWIWVAVYPEIRVLVPQELWQEPALPELIVWRDTSPWGVCDRCKDAIATVRACIDLPGEPTAYQTATMAALLQRWEANFDVNTTFTTDGPTDPRVALMYDVLLALATLPHEPWAQRRRSEFEAYQVSWVEVHDVDRPD